MAYSKDQKCPYCGYVTVIWGLFREAKHPGSGDGIFVEPMVICFGCQKGFKAVSSDVVDSAAVLAVGPRKEKGSNR